MDDLEAVFGELARVVPDGPVGEADFVFDKRVLPVPSREMSCERIIMRKGHHDYNGWYRADVLLLFVEPDISRQLGLFLLACAFHEPESVTLAPSMLSDIRKLVYRHANGTPGSVPVGLRQSASTFRYFPEVVSKHPWRQEIDNRSLPLLALSSPDENPSSVEDWEGRDTVFVASSPEGTVRLAELLLNAGCSWNRTREFVLEGEAGFRGVAPLSAELRIALPGSPLWNAHLDPTGAGA